MTAPERHSLVDIAARFGTSVASAGNLPAELDDPDCFWFIDEGTVDLFLVETRNGVQQSAPQHLLRAGAGRLLPGVAPQGEETTLGLIAKGLPNTTMRRVPVTCLREVRPAELAAEVDAWLLDLSATLVRGAENQPRPDVLVEPEQALPAERQTLASRRGVAWISELNAGSGLYLDLIDPAEHGHGGAAAVPLTPASWLTLLDAAPFTVRSSETLADEGLLLSALVSFHAAAFALIGLDRSMAVIDQANLERARARSRRTDEEFARRRLFDLYDLLPDDRAAGDSALIEVLRIIGRREGIDFRFAERGSISDAPVDLEHTINASGVRARRVRLTFADKWWLGDSNAMLAFRKEDNRPVALLPGLLGRYREIDPAGRRSHRVTAQRAAALSEEAWIFYRPLPSRSLVLADLFWFAVRGSQFDLARLMLVGLLGGLILLVPALVLGLVADKAIPDGDTGLLYALCATLAALASVGALLQLLRSMALLRLEARTGSRAEAAFWDRLLRLPSGVLRRYPVGDLAMRGMTFQHLRDAMQGGVANGVLSVVFLLPVFVVIFFHDGMLGGVALAFGLVSLIVTVVLGLRQIAPSARAIDAARRVTGHLFQMVGGMFKLRTDSAEGSAFAVWARNYREQKKAEMETSAVESHMQAFGAALPLMAGAVLLLAAALPGRQTIPVADFLVVFTVFMAFQT
ncbi:MAG: ABC transporter transmembrane domain-containing protein, partial [Alphaproteobacteria bacterium]|nr:ABC transporter transmembrane domain-containing protein [Alphaproteobacteria bacterium]